MRQWHLYPDSKKLFINIGVVGAIAFSKSITDGIQIYCYPYKSGDLFIDIDWVIDRKIVGPKSTQRLKELKKEIFEINKTLLGD